MEFKADKLGRLRSEGVELEEVELEEVKLEGLVLGGVKPERTGFGRLELREV